MTEAFRLKLFWLHTPDSGPGPGPGPGPRLGLGAASLSLQVLLTVSDSESEAPASESVGILLNYDLVLNLRFGRLRKGPVRVGSHGGQRPGPFARGEPHAAGSA